MGKDRGKTTPFRGMFNKNSSHVCLKALSFIIVSVSDVNLTLESVENIFLGKWNDFLIEILTVLPGFKVCNSIEEVFYELSQKYYPGSKYVFAMDLSKDAIEKKLRSGKFEFNKHAVFAVSGNDISPDTDITTVPKHQKSDFILRRKVHSR